jgi:hypothetical protein
MRALGLLLLLIGARVTLQDCCGSCYGAITETLTNTQLRLQLLEFCRVDYGCELSCGIGTYAKYCSEILLLKTTKCQACEAGTYRNNIATQAACVTCKTCSATQIETSACGPVNDRVCQECPAGTIKSNNQCVNCPTGKYTLDRLTCSACTTCSTSEKQIADCLTGQNRECQKCPTGQRAASENSACTLCVDGYYQITGTAVFTCSPCSSVACTVGTWIQCVGGTKECKACDGQNRVDSTKCAVGKGVPGKCSGSDLANTPCTDCIQGTERLENTPMVDEAQRCVKCATGKFKPTRGTQPCADCTGKPEQSIYRDRLLNEEATTCPW